MSGSISKLHPATILSTWFWSGLSPKAPGTVGSLAALPFGFVILVYGGQIHLLLATVVVFLLGTFTTHIYVTRTGKSDPKEVVIDEVAGQWLAILVAGTSPLALLLGFLFFRLFDIWKPWPISWMDKNIKGAIGVMLDDLVAGLFALGAVIIVLKVIA
ncbi:phosphatidylglycerophosphatase A [Sneathiella limimaris]|uniref:phosphatidylglycerophosphatase A family protein n=1 Tax=Sneathiella limimaris TaxID=1964213 RepID=UPI00146EEEDC|nr:phosphatidylglycerophosphatase A [Sneathiella limimaris]